MATTTETCQGGHTLSDSEKEGSMAHVMEIFPVKKEEIVNSGNVGGPGEEETSAGQQHAHIHRTTSVARDSTVRSH